MQGDDGERYNLIDEAVDGSLSQQDYDAVREMLANDPEARHRYCELTTLKWSLVAEYAGEAASPTLKVQRIPRAIWWGATVAACMLLGFAWVASRHGVERAPSGEHGPVATAPATGGPNESNIAAMFGALPDAKWLAEGPQPKPGQLLSGSRTYGLDSGVAQVFVGGIEVIVAAGTDFRLIEDGIALERGMIAVRSPEGLSGLNVHTPQVDLVDIGTTFAVLVEADGRIRLDVFDGLVRASAANGDDLGVVAEGRARMFGAGGGGELQADWAQYLPTFPFTSRWPLTGPAAARDSGLFGQVTHRWHAGDLGVEPKVLEWPVNHRLSGASALDLLVMPEHDQTAHFSYFELLENGTRIWHQSIGAHQPRMFRLWLPVFQPGRVYTLRTSASASKGEHASGQIWLKVTPLEGTTLRPPPSIRKNNIALHAAVRAENTKPAHPREGDQRPERAVDGATTYERNWWACYWPGTLTVEFPDTRRIDSILCRMHYKGNRGCEYAVDISEDGETWTEVVSVRGVSFTATREGDYHVFSPVNARFLRFHALKSSNNEAFHLVELEVFAED